MAPPQGGCPQAAGPIKAAKITAKDPIIRMPMPDTNAPPGTPEPATPEPAVSVVVPVRNEADNVRLLADEIAAALNGRYSFELIYVNDGSTDGTQAALAALKAERTYLRQIKHAASCGQSSAVRSGVAAARAAIIVTLDGDGEIE